METPELIEAIIADIRRVLIQVDAGQIDAACAAILAADRVFIAGKGRSGLQMKAFAMRLMHLGLRVHVVDDVTTPAIGAKDLLLIGSASGRTGSLLHYAEVAVDAGAGMTVFTGAPTSAIAEAATTLVYIPATNFKACEQTGNPSALVMGSLFEHSLGLLCDLLIIRLKAALAIDESAMNARHANLE